MIWLKILILGLCATLSLTKRQEVEEVTKRQLDTLIKSEDYLAVFWCKYIFININNYFLN